MSKHKADRVRRTTQGSLKEKEEKGKGDDELLDISDENPRQGLMGS